MATEAGLVRGQFKIDVSFRETTLGEHGLQSIIGPPQAFRVAPLDICYRAKIGDFVERDPRLRNKAGLRMLHCLAHSLTHLGVVDLTELSVDERIIHLGRLHMTDLMYSTYARMADVNDGKHRVDLPPESRCPHCYGPLPNWADVDLTTLAVNVYDEAPRGTYRLIYPWQVRKLAVDTVTMRPVDMAHGLAAMTDQEVGHNFTRQAMWVAASIVEINGKRASVSYDDLVKPSKELGHGLRDADFDAMADGMGELQAGPALGVNWTHPACGKQIPVGIPWGAPFFGHGAVSIRGFT